MSDPDLSYNEPMNIHIRLCEAADLAALEYFIPSPNSLHSKRFEEQEDGACAYLIAFVDSQPVGHLNILWQGRADAALNRHLKNCPELNAIGVIPQYQSQGIGAKLINLAEQMVKSSGFDKVGLGVGIDNPRAKQLYERLGYRDWGHGTLTDSGTIKDGNGQRVTFPGEMFYLIKDLG